MRVIFGKRAAVEVEAMRILAFEAKSLEGVVETRDEKIKDLRCLVDRLEAEREAILAVIDRHCDWGAHQPLHNRLEAFMREHREKLAAYSQTIYELSQRNGVQAKTIHGKELEREAADPDGQD